MFRCFANLSGISRNAAQAEIREAYKILALRWYAEMFSGFIAYIVEEIGAPVTSWTLFKH